ncbi:restriction endonuclease subunit S [Klebsiella quasipneumoniae]|uniref:restriction endonuclease subunit S n=1 Tax=Klebsiella quasipneumoniae TaxID=1463165 RepID=UPI00371E9B8A
MAKYKAYPEYKDSGVDFLGLVPNEWSIKSLKNIVMIFNGSTPKSGVEEYWDGDVNWITPTDLSQKSGVYLTDSQRKITKKGLDSCGTSLVPENTVILSTRAPIGSLAITGTQSCTNQGCKSLVAKYKESSLFLYYYLSISTSPLKNLGRGSTFLELSTEDLASFKVPMPNVGIGTIVSFLDHETAKIDNLIEKQQQLIELLKEKRQAVISHAVTKGLNLDVPMTDSGVEWLGELPSHWQALPTKRLFRLVAEPAEINNDYELLSVYTAIGVAPRKDLEPKGNKASTTDGYWKVRQGDIIVNKLLAWMGAVGFSNYDGVTSPAYDILRKVKDINPKFYHYLFRLELTQREFKRWSRGIMEMRLRLYFEELGRIIMPVPPRQEQDVIVEEIEKIEHQYSQLENIASHQIDLLQERRTALISAAVTGKIDVRDWVAPDAQDIEEPQEATA